MKVSKALRFAMFGIAVVAMLLPVAQFVNPINQHSGQPILKADGAPFPPLPPGLNSNATQLVADGAPFPPLPPQGALVADGAPFPPLPPQGVLMADGAPFPPLPPPGVAKA